MKYFSSVIYLSVGVILPLVYLSIIDKINSREIFLLVVIFISCVSTGIWFIFANKTNNKSIVSDKRAIPSSHEQIKPSPIRPSAERIKDRAAIKKVGLIGEPTCPTWRPVRRETTSPVRTTVTNPPESPKFEVEALMEDIKNLIKLESWLMALQKANELIHYYPDSPEADKIRGSINSLVQKVQENRPR